VETWLALIGSSVPLRGAQSPTLRRPSRALRTYRRVTGSLIERRGLAVGPGTLDTRHVFVAVDDAATFLVGTIDHPVADRTTLAFGGPEALSWQTVLGAYGTVLDRPVRGLSLPDLALRLGGRLARPVSTATSNLFGLNRLVAATGTHPGSDAAGWIVDWERTTVERFLRDRADLPDPSSSRLGWEPAIGTGAS
jgi:uncharacterized protein YbjT (DUF2867 family)